MDLYKHIQKRSILEPDLSDKFITSQGPFHIVLCALRCLGSTLESSGLDESWIEAGLYSSVTTAQILEGSHHSRALAAHQISLQVLFDLWINMFFEQNPDLCTEMTVAIQKVQTVRQTNDGVDQSHTLR